MQTNKYINVCTSCLGMLCVSVLIYKGKCVCVCVCVCCSKYSHLWGVCISASQSAAGWLGHTHACSSSVRVFIDLCASVYVFLFHDIKLQVMCLRKCVGESMQRPDLLCCIAARPAQPEVAVVLRQGILPRSQQVNPPHLHTQPLQG